MLNPHVWWLTISSVQYNPDKDSDYMGYHVILKLSRNALCPAKLRDINRLVCVCISYWYMSPKPSTKHMSILTQNKAQQIIGKNMFRCNHCLSSYLLWNCVCNSLNPVLKLVNMIPNHTCSIQKNVTYTLR